MSWRVSVSCFLLQKKGCGLLTVRLVQSWADFVNQHKGSRSKTSEGIPRHALCRLQQLLKGEEELPKSRKDLEQDIASVSLSSVSSSLFSCG